MKHHSILWCLLTVVMCAAFTGIGFSQVAIGKDEIPSAVGTTWTTLNDTTDHFIVNVGSAGENQRWEFLQPFDGVEIRQSVVSLDSTSYGTVFPEANFVLKYEAGLLDLIYSGIFPEIEGDVYFFQQITDSAILILGTGFTSSWISAVAPFDPPNVVLNFVPTQYLDEWVTKSAFSITKDTTVLGVSLQYTLSVNDSAWSIIDGWGKVVLPLGEFDCLRMKSYVFMDEKLLLNGETVHQNKARVINYNWIAENYGMVVRAASHTGEPDDAFTDARLFFRMTDFHLPSTGLTLDPGQTGRARSYGLLPNYPNPFNAQTVIPYDLPSEGRTAMTVVNPLGQVVRTVVDGFQSAGMHRVVWDGLDSDGHSLPSGMYLIWLQWENDHGSVQRLVQGRKILLVK